MQEETRAGRKRSCDIGSATSVQRVLRSIHYMDTGERKKDTRNRAERRII